MKAASLIPQLELAKNGLEDAQIAFCGAVTAYTEAKRALELAKARKLCGGVDGRNEGERTARLRLELATEYAMLATVEDELTEARCRLEVARLEWDFAQYSSEVLKVKGLREAA